MKKLLFLLLTLVLSFSLFACKPEDEETGDTNKPAPTPGFSEPIDTEIVDIPLS